MHDHGRHQTNNGSNEYAPICAPAGEKRGMPLSRRTWQSKQKYWSECSTKSFAHVRRVRRSTAVAHKSVTCQRGKRNGKCTCGLRLVHLFCPRWQAYYAGLMRMGECGMTSIDNEEQWQDYEHGSLPG